MFLRTKGHLEAWSVNNSYVWAVRLPKEVASAVNSFLKSNHLHHHLINSIIIRSPFDHYGSDYHLIR